MSDTPARKMISVVIPAWNESEVIDELTSRLAQLAARQNGYDWEFIIVENGSWDDSWAKLAAAHERDPRFKPVQLSRNFMADGGVMAGLAMASGDAAVVMNADLQDPPELVDEFIKKWEAGFEIIYGVIERRRGEPLWKRKLSDVYYGIINRLTGGLIPKDVSDFRLIDRKVYLAMNTMQEANRFTRGLSIWTGFKQTGIPFIRPPRFAGESKAPWWDLIGEAMNGIFAFSRVPLKFATWLGLFTAAGAVVVWLWNLLASMIWGRDFPGYLTLLTVTIFMFGLLFVVLGVIGEYLGRIYDEVKARPNYIIRQTRGFDDPPEGYNLIGTRYKP